MNKFKDYSDQNLVDLLKQQNMAAFEEIYNRYWRKLYSTAYRRIQSREIAEEFVQDIFTSLWINRELVHIKSLTAYLYTAVKYKVINHLHHESIRKQYFNLQLKTLSEADNCTEELVFANDLHVSVQKEISKLPPKCQQVFKLSRQENLTMKQIASQLGISEKTVEHQLGKALRVLRMNIKQIIVVISSTIGLI
ncbi:RNA polymerase sigma-70 factor [Ohtaekwangia koreensis]|uniref:RNA polymerase sigma-70 factor, ECF subfamily n=1 Tax=Ohtaekwangia koreensis TaxID=688867 RepID=A0A1T5MGS0_9BACT|nr:RNA polymerase sigma-70 factor [Ohtaekwangia koreensis]SKC87427.1 RNA polymerase sigma-70 factor, ECF subfamily [Ohtaekwangia koreensis]